MAAHANNSTQSKSSRIPCPRLTVSRITGAMIIWMFQIFGLALRGESLNKKFAETLLREGVDAMLSGDVETGKTILRDTITATVGFEKLGEATDTSPKSLIRMFGPRGNP
jgi:hypothetical protein